MQIVFYHLLFEFLGMPALPQDIFSVPQAIAPNLIEIVQITVYRLPFELIYMPAQPLHIFLFSGTLAPI